MAIAVDHRVAQPGVDLGSAGGRSVHLTRPPDCESERTMGETGETVPRHPGYGPGTRRQLSQFSWPPRTQASRFSILHAPSALHTAIQARITHTATAADPGTA